MNYLIDLSSPIYAEVSITFFSTFALQSWHFKHFFFSFYDKFGVVLKEQKDRDGFLFSKFETGSLIVIWTKFQQLQNNDIITIILREKRKCYNNGVNKL